MNNFQEDVEFLQKYVEIILLEKGDAKLVVCPSYQGRVLTSSSEGWTGKSNGWINYSLIEGGKIHPLLNPYGGEDRIWLGPEAGQYGLFFQKNEPFDVAHAKTPSALDRESFEIEGAIEKEQIQFNKKFTCKNYADYEFRLELNRKIQLLESPDFLTGTSLTETNYLGYRSANTLINVGDQKWSRETGLLSLWAIGMFPASPSSQVIVPLNSVGAELSSYFSDLDASRIKIKDKIAYFLGDGNYRSKIGVKAEHCGAFICGLDLARESLTIIRFKKAEETAYVNSQWEIQDEPYGGDLLNSYNDGPNDKGESLGVFYELESSSPALALGPNESYEHWQDIWHFSGSSKNLIKLVEEISADFDPNNLF